MKEEFQNIDIANKGYFNSKDILNYIYRFQKSEQEY